MILFAYSTILGWSYYGNRCVTYLFGKRAIRPYQVLYVAVAFLGAIGVGEVVWTVSDITNALMAMPEYHRGVAALRAHRDARRSTTSTSTISTSATRPPSRSLTASRF